MKTSTFGRKRDEKRMLLRNLAAAVILYESIVTTEPKARTIQPIVDRLISVGLTDDPLTARRKLSAFLPDENAVNKIVNELTARYKGVTSGFTRRFALPPRKGDGAPLAIVQLTRTVLLQDAPQKENKGEKARTKSTPAKGNNEAKA